MPTATPEPIHALLLDDHAVVREGLGRLLERAGIDVVATTSELDDCWELVRLHDPRLVVLDLRLADGATCLDLIGQLRADRPDLAIAVLTSYVDPAAARRALQAGANGFLIKDIDPHDLTRQLQSIVNGAVIVDHRVGVAATRGQVASLSDQERAVVQLVGHGMTNREIGEQLHLAPDTVKKYLAKATNKLGARTRSEAVAIALRDHLIDPP